MIHPSDVDIYRPYLETVDYCINRLEEEWKDPVLVDAGCGHSTVLESQYRRCMRVIGVDSDRKALNKNSSVKEKMFTRLDSIPLPDESAHIITSSWVLEHIDKPYQVMSEFYRLLKPGGYLVFITPNSDSWYAQLASLLPSSLNDVIAKTFLKRGEGDTYDTHYYLNNEEDLDKILVKGLYMKQLQIKYNDDPKYMRSFILTRPLANLWHQYVMKDGRDRSRVHIIGLYQKPV